MNCPFCNLLTVSKKIGLIYLRQCINHEMAVYFYPAVNCTIFETKKYSISIYDNSTHLYIYDLPSMIDFKFKINVTPDTFNSTVSKLLKLKAYY